MPRKRKRSTLQRKPSLMFIESPVHVQRNVPSPVFCARHPPTADAVPVDNIHQLSWVSPQFQSTAGSSGRHKITRRRRKSIACLRNLNKENTCSDNQFTKRHTNAKFRSLRFVSDPSIDASELNIHITVDSDTATEDENVREIENNQFGIRGKQKRKEHKLVKKVTEDIADNGDGDLTLGSVPETNDSSANDEQNFQNGITDRHVLNESSQIDFTRVRKRRVTMPPVKRLFATQLKDSSPFNVDGALSSGNDKRVCSETEPETVSESESGVDTTPPVRRSLRIHTLKSMLHATPVPHKSGVILAPDTPEEEYGWPLRKRQLRNHVKDR